METRFSRMCHIGFDKTIKESTQTSHHYRCSLYRSKMCKADLAISIGDCKISEKATHTWIAVTVSSAVTDIRAQMIYEGQNLSLSKPENSAKWICEELNLKYIPKRQESGCDEIYAIIKKAGVTL
ncbi:hypothetical protein RF11_06359 [Thelohanellus kitauei]|uniref:FLYWCH-type domain-containing protein n=1 Tax=Thelohanellus kitauei TaxID=669202 RepID=A0A0C2MRB8_THEKT|nr:hypothetical protein RF11_06359 [Thelohanellus kitauei]